MVLKARYRRKFVNITSPEALWTNRPPLLHTRRVALLTLTLTLFGQSYVKNVHFIILQYNISTVLNFANGCELHSWCRYYTDQTHPSSFRFEGPKYQDYVILMLD